MALRFSRIVPWLLVIAFVIEKLWNDTGLRESSGIGSLYDSVVAGYSSCGKSTGGSSAHNYRFDDGDDDLLASRAVAFVQTRQDAHQAAGYGRHWHLRGVGYVREVHGLVLVARPPPGRLRVGKTAAVTIWDVGSGMDGGSGSGNSNAFAYAYAGDSTRKVWTLEECDKFSLWVRVRGAEIFAGLARAVGPDPDGVRPSRSSGAAGNARDGRCRWEYEFQPSRAGTYEIDAKILQWNGKQPRTDDVKCHANDTGVTGLRDAMARYPLHAGWQGFKMYTPAVSCCEFCARLHPHCRYWSSPPFNLPDASYLRNGCELYFAPETPEELIPRSHLHSNLNISIRDELRGPNASYVRGDIKYEHGPPHGQVPAMHYAGCGWSNWFTLDFPCLSGELDDKVYITENSFVVIDSVGFGATGSASTLPHCQLREERNPSGRWLVEPWNETACPKPMKFDNRFGSRFAITEFDGSRPHCWHRDDLSVIGHRCIEMNCGLITQDSKWISALRNGSWFGTWSPWDCEYAEFTDDELQSCIDSRHITRFKTEGRSISDYLNQYLQQRLSNVRMYNESTEKGIVATLSTMGILHHGGLTDEELSLHLQKISNATSDQEYFVVGGLFLSSERDTYANAERSRVVSKAMADVLTPKGYKYLDFFHLSAAISFDSATQFDGMHIIGPPMKMILTKFFHYLCKDVGVLKQDSTAALE